MKTIAAASAPTTNKPRPTYSHASLVMDRNVTGSDSSRYPLKGPIVVIRNVILVIALTACATANRARVAGEHAAVVCGKQSAPSIASLLAHFGVLAALGKLDQEAAETAGLGAGAGVGSCALAEFLREYKRLAKVQVAALGGAPDMVVQLQAALARVSGGATVQLADGMSM